jgi:Cu+-exporting ATPase
VAGTGIAARNGIVIRDLAALEAAATVETVAFDKTGTITEGQPQVVAISAPGVGSEDALKIAAALAAVSDHPLAKAVIAAAQDRGIAGAPATDVVAIPGEGLVGRVNGVEALFGSADFLRQRGIVLGVIEQVITNDQSFGEAQSISWLAGANRVIGAIAFSDAVRPHVREALADLSSMGVSTLLLSGDRPATTAAIARDIGISEAKGGLKPEAKVAALRAMTSAGRRLAMVGDGINDAPALAAAHVGMAMGTGSEAARAAAGITLMRPDLSLVPKTLRVARRTRATIRQNLFLAFVFNVVSIPLAAFGQLTPAIAGAAMAASSVLVVLNAWRLARIRV